jgi:hypothetical protein
LSVLEKNRPVPNKTQMLFESSDVRAADDVTGPTLQGEALVQVVACVVV